MDSHNLINVWGDLGKLTQDLCSSIQVTAEEQTLRLDDAFHNILTSVWQNTGNKTVKRQSRKAHLSNHVGDLFASENYFQKPSQPSVDPSKKLSSIVAADEIQNTGGSSALSLQLKPIGENRSRGISTGMDISHFTRPNANSTFVVECKKISSNNNNQNLLPANKINDFNKNSNVNDTYNISSEQSKKNSEKHVVSSDNVENILTENNVESIDKKMSLCPKDRKREKLEDIDVNVDELAPHNMSRIKKKKFEDGDKVIHVPLEKQMAPQSHVEATSLTPYQCKENEAAKRKELFLKQKSDQKKNDELQIKAAKLREERTKLLQEKIRKVAEEKLKKEENKKVKEMLFKTELKKTRHQTEIRKAEVAARQKQAEEAKLLKAQKAEAERLAKLRKLENKKLIVPQNTSTPAFKKILKPKTETQNMEKIVNNDYGLNDISARDSSEDESRPRKQIPEWAKKENRTAQLEIESLVSSECRDLFFNCPTQINLKQMFRGFSIRDRPRTSSAVWTTPPKFLDHE